MSARFLYSAVAVFAFTALIRAADTPVNLTGTWTLNLSKSDFGERPAPKSIEVKLKHEEPNLHYTGTFVDPDGNPHDISVDAVLDGKPRPGTGENGGSASAKRIDAKTIVMEWKSDDGNISETSTMVAAEDGKSCVIKRKVSTPQGEFASTEFYDKH